MSQTSLSVGRFIASDSSSLYELTELYEGAFRKYVSKGDFSKRRKAFASELAQRGNVIARLEGRAIGFGTMERCQSTGVVARLLQTWRVQRPDGQGIRRYRGATQWAVLRRGSWLLTAMAVSPLHRRKGIGKAMATARIEHARTRGAPAIFVTCIQGAGSTQLYRDLGFDPILEVDRYYPDKSGVTLLALVL